MEKEKEDIITWNIIDSFFKDNPQTLVQHHIESYNDFFKTGIFQILRDKNPIRLQSDFDETINEFRSQCEIYIGGRDGSRVYFGKPVIYDTNNTHSMFPNEARLRNMTYGMTIHYDIEVEFTDILREGQTPRILGDDFLEEIEQYDEAPEFQYFKDKPAEFVGDGDEKEVQGGAIPTKSIARKPTKKAPMTGLQAMEARIETEKSLDVANKRQKYRKVFERVYLGRFPIMIQSDFCILRGLPREIRHSMGECRNDIGGYFIIDGKEKTVVSQEKFADNMLYIRKFEPNSGDKYLYSAEIRSVSENVSKPIRKFSVKMVAPTSKYTFGNIVVDIPNVRLPVPLFIVFRALGVLTDKDIIQMCLLDIKKYESFVDVFTPSVYDSGSIFTQQHALKYISTLTKRKTVTAALEIMTDYFLPHIGETNYLQKAYYLGYMVFRLLSVAKGLETPTDRDNFRYKRMELVGSLMYDLFSEYFTIQQNEIRLKYETILLCNRVLYDRDLLKLITKHQMDIFKVRSLEAGFKKAFKGNWGAYTHTKRVGVVQDLNRLSHNSYLSHLRKTNLPIDSGLKIVGPRLLHGSQWGIIDPADTPDGGNIGIHKQLAISTYITQGISREPMIEWMREYISLKKIEECPPLLLSKMTKVIINGYWCGSVSEPLASIEKMRFYRRNALLPIYTSVSFDIRQNTIFIYTDAGRLCRPIFYIHPETLEPSYRESSVYPLLLAKKFNWLDLITGFNEKHENLVYNPYRFYKLHELYKGINASEQRDQDITKYEKFLKKKAILEYIDTSESETSLIALRNKNIEKQSTHLEIHPSMILGVLTNMTTFPESNQAPRNTFSAGQSRQACSIYHTNFQNRMDKASVVLNNTQIPLVKSRYMEYINHEENCYGENTIVAIMCYTGYNVEDAILINQGALDRGLFATTYYTTYEAHEENSANASSSVDIRFTNIENTPNLVGTKPGYDYNYLDNYGIIAEGTPVTDKTVLIGVVSKEGSGDATRFLDHSKTPKKGQLGIVDKTFITQGEEGQRIAKVRIREKRVPTLGDKMASRNGQKGTIGLVIREEDMPFTRDGIRPDIIINPHAIPTRMTIGQLIETIMGKACVHYGGYGDSTPFQNDGSKLGVFGELLTEQGFHSTGNEILYNGMTGEQIESSIFIGPTYYMRLKHMVKDKINFRARGPNEMMTRQPVGGRANDGGLRIGIMEADSINAHGMVSFLTESMMERADKYYMAVCNKTGLIAVYNPAKKIFLSPMVDGLHMTTTLDGKNYQIHPMTKYGRDFSVVCIPYSLKLLIQELQTMNIVFRVITEDNIGQIENMSYSSNMIQLLGLGADIEHDKETIMKQIEGEMLFRDRKTPKAPVYMPMLLPEPITQITTEPEPEMTGSPQYATTSPAYMPTEEDLENIVGRTSPAYMPDEYGSPQYATTSPAYMPSEEDLENIVGRTSPAYIPSMDDEETESEIQVGDNVIIRGGKNRHPVTNQSPSYKVTEKLGDNIVIESPEDGDVRVVSPYEIMKIHVSQMHPMQMQMPTMSYGQGYAENHATLEENKFHYGDTQKPSIVFKPTINVVNGSENQLLPTASVEPSTEGFQTVPQYQPMPTMMPLLPSVQIKKIGATEPSPMTKDIMVKSNSNDIPSYDKGATETDFFNTIVVKKLDK